MMTHKVEVRCCCDPSRLLGWIDVDGALLRPGFPVRFPMLVSYESLIERPDSPERLSVLGVCELYLGEVVGRDGVRSLAFNSREMPEEKLRHIQGFTPAQ